jgi:hypothetical protein
LWAVTLNVPLSLVPFAIADSDKCPALLRNVLSPGIAFEEHLPPAYGSLADTISRVGTVGLAVNAAYYTVILWFVFMIFRIFLDT